MLTYACGRWPQALEEEAKKAESEREAEGGDGGDDHDMRRLKKGDRMRMVVKNKEEGNELFSGGNYKVQQLGNGWRARNEYRNTR